MKPWLTPVLIIFALGGLAFWARQREPKLDAIQAIDCKDVVTGCNFVYNGQPSQLRFSAVPRPMTPFSIELHAPAAARVAARFQMGGMDMGFNRYDFKATRGGEFRAESMMLPVCSQARSDWTAVFTLDATSYRVEFQAR